MGFAILNIIALGEFHDTLFIQGIKDTTIRAYSNGLFASKKPYFIGKNP
ncbi:MAG: hypothetical protein ACXVPN_05480 [Bacteroidia bacterium]